MPDRAPFDGHVRRKPLSVVIRDLLPPYPQIGERVVVVLDGETSVPGKVIHPRIAEDVFRIALTELDGSMLQ